MISKLILIFVFLSRFAAHVPEDRSTKTAKTVQSRCNEKQVSGIFLIKFNISYLNCIDCRVDLIVLHYASQGLNKRDSKNSGNCFGFV